MVDAHEVDDPDDESVSLAFGPDVGGWPTAQQALDAFVADRVVAAGGPQGPDGAPEGQPAVEYESDDEVTWTLSSGGVRQGWVSAMHGPTGWVIQAYSRHRR
jgi:hypothetical protein